MTFEEWFEVGDEDWPYEEQLAERFCEGNLDPVDVKGLMKEAYKAGKEAGYEECYENHNLGFPSKS